MLVHFHGHIVQLVNNIYATAPLLNWQPSVSDAALGPALWSGEALSFLNQACSFGVPGDPVKQGLLHM